MSPGTWQGIGEGPESRAHRTACCGHAQNRDFRAPIESGRSAIRPRDEFAGLGQAPMGPIPSHMSPCAVPARAGPVRSTERTQEAAPVRASCWNEMMRRHSIRDASTAIWHGRRASNSPLWLLRVFGHICNATRRVPVRDEPAHAAPLVCQAQSMPGQVELRVRGLQSIASRASYAFQRAQRSYRPGPPILVGLLAEICGVLRRHCPDCGQRL